MTEYYERRSDRRLLIITVEEYSKVMEFVKRNQGAFSVDLFVMEKSIPIQKNPNDRLTLTETVGGTEESVIRLCNIEVYESELLSREIYGESDDKK